MKAALRATLAALSLCLAAAKVDGQIPMVAALAGEDGGYDEWCRKVLATFDDFKDQKEQDKKPFPLPKKGRACATLAKVRCKDWETEELQPACVYLYKKAYDPKSDLVVPPGLFFVSKIGGFAKAKTWIKTIDDNATWERVKDFADSLQLGFWSRFSDAIEQTDKPWKEKCNNLWKAKMYKRMQVRSSLCMPRLCHALLLISDYFRPYLADGSLS
jgi:hypothetical protein